MVTSRDYMLYLLCLAIVLALLHLLYVHMKMKPSSNGNQKSDPLTTDLRVSVILKKSYYGYLTSFDEIGIARLFATGGCLVYSGKGAQIGKVVKITFPHGNLKLTVQFDRIPESRWYVDSIINKRMFFVPKFSLSSKQGIGNGQDTICHGIHSLVLVASTNNAPDTEVHSL